MRSLDDIVTGLWKPKEPERKYDLVINSKGFNFKPQNVPIKDKHTYRYNYYIYQKLLRTPFYGRDVQEPVVKICKRILDKPNRFHLVKDYKVEQTIKSFRGCVLSVTETVGWKVIQDKDTQQKFVRKDTGGVVSNLSCLTYDEQVLLTAVLCEWYNHQKEILAEKKAIREEKRKQKFRKELSDLYEGY